MQAPNNTDQINDTPRRLIRAVFQYWKSGLGFFVVFFTFLMVLAYTIPPSYTAHASVLVKSGRENAPEGTASTSEYLRLISSAEEVISEISIMLSRPVLKQVAINLEKSHSREKVDSKTGFGARRLGFQNWSRRIGLLTGPQLPNGKLDWDTLRDYPTAVSSLIEQILPVIEQSRTPGWSLDLNQKKSLKDDLEVCQTLQKRAGLWKSLAALDPIMETVEDAFSDLQDGDTPRGEFVMAEWDDLLEESGAAYDRVIDFSHERAIQKLGNVLKIEIVPATHVITIAFEHESKNVSAETITLLIKAYLNQHTKIHADASQVDPETGEIELTAGDFFLDQAEIFSLQVAELQNEITEFRQNHDGGDLSRQRDLLLDDLITSDQSLRALQEIRGGDEELAAASVLESPEIAFFHQRLLDLRLEMAKRRSQYSDPNHPEVTEIASQLAASRSELVIQMKRKRDFLERRVAVLREELRQVESDRAQYEALMEKRNKAQSSWNKYSAKAEEEKINRALDLQLITNIKVLEWPATPSKPSFPNRFMLALLGIFLGIPSSIAVTLLRAYFHSRVSSVVDVETVLETPVIASIGQFSRWGGRQSFSEGMPGAVMDAARMVLASMDGSGARALHVAASTSIEGADTLAAAISLVLSQDQKKVVFATESGFPAVLSGTEGIEILQLGDLPIDAKRKAIVDARGKADLVVMAGPCLASGGGGGMWASLADASVFVVSGSGVHFEVARRGLSILHRYSPLVIGAVLTQRRDSIPSWLYKRA